MYKVFVEYAIIPEMRQVYLDYMQELCLREGRLELFEGSDQPGLFVEIWHDVSYEFYTLLKQERLNFASSDSTPWEEWVQGGKKKLHIWHFSKVI
jgi:hypothetical protein